MRWGVDLGGTKIEAAIVVEEGETVWRGRIPTEQEKGYEHIVGQLTRVVEIARQESGEAWPERIGVGIPGTLDPGTQEVKNANTQCLNGRRLQEDLTEALRAEVAVANDANCFTLAEATLGAARGYGVVFGVILGTGVGGGIVVDGRVLPGRHGIAGEWGHNLLDPEGHLAYSGHRGVVESVLAGPSLERFYYECTGTRRSLGEIVRRSQELAAMRTLDRLCEQFGKAVAQVVNLLDPDAIVLGGGVSNVHGLYERGPAEAAKWVFNHEFRTPILKAELGDSAGVFGAAMLVG